MATTKQARTARRNVKSAQRAARRQRTISKLPRSVRQDLGRRAREPEAAVASPVTTWRIEPGRSSTRWRKKKSIRGRSRMGKWDLIKAIRQAWLTCQTSLVGHRRNHREDRRRPR